VDAALGSLYGCPFVITARAIVERERGGAVVSLASARVIRTEDGAVIAIRSRQVRYRRARGMRGYRTALASASSRLARSLIPEIRRVFPPRRARRAGGGKAVAGEPPGGDAEGGCDMILGAVKFFFFARRFLYR
jgi:hypothetical protein